jgi:hypothetical protein
MDFPTIRPQGTSPQPQIPNFQRMPSDNTRVRPVVRPPDPPTMAPLGLKGSASAQVGFVDFAHPQVAALASRLQPAQLQQLQVLYAQFPDLTVQLDRLATEPAKHPRLLATDHQGRTTLEHLARLASAPQGKFGVNPQQMVRDLVPRLNDRTTMFQGPQFTCGSAALQNYLQNKHPGTLTRIMADLALNGQTTLKDGSKLKPPKEMATYLKEQSTYSFGTKQEKDVRPACDVLFQSSVMSDISLVGGNRAWKGDKDIVSKSIGWLTDWASYNPKGDEDGFKARLRGDGGGDPFLLQQLMEDMTGEDIGIRSMINVGHLWGDRSNLQGRLEDMARHPGKELVGLLKSPLHYVLITGYNPQTQQVTLVSTGTYKTDTETLSLKAFLDNCGALIGPR